MINNKFHTIIKNSKDSYYRFYINNNNDLILEEYTSSTLINTKTVISSVSDYSIDVDDHNIIHILYLCSDGTLKYLLYGSNENETILSNFDLINNSISFLTLKLLCSEVHIFYMVNNKQNHFQYAIYHNMWKNSKWILEKISDISSIKYPCAFSVDIDSKKNLYFFYPKNSSNNFSIKKYSSEFSLWTDFEDNLIIDNIKNVTFFISNKDMAVICYNQTIADMNLIFIKHINLTIINSIWSEPIQISNLNSSSPSIFTKNECLYLMWEENSNIVYKQCSQLSQNWSEKKLLVNKNTNIYNSIYISNAEISGFKSSYIYYAISPYPIALIDIDNIKNFEFNLNKTIDTPIQVAEYNNELAKNPLSNLSEQLNKLSQENYKKNLEIEKLNSEINKIKEKNKEKLLIIEKLTTELIDTNIKNYTNSPIIKNTYTKKNKKTCKLFQKD